MEPTISARKAQIISVAQNQFRIKGYAATSMRDLAKEIGIEPASLYSHISSKEEILSDICFRLAQKFFDQLDQINTDGLSLEDRLKAMIEGHVTVISGEIDAAAVFLHDWPFLSEPDLSRFKQLRDDYISVFHTMIQDGIDDGNFRQVDVRFLTLSIFSSINWIYDWYDPKGSMTIEQIGSELSKIILNGITNSDQSEPKTDNSQ